MHRTTRSRDITRESLMVFNIACRQIIAMLAFEFSKQILWHLAQNIHQHIQSAAVRHANHNLLYALATRALNGFI